jgi:hypothetical protein
MAVAYRTISAAVAVASGTLTLTEPTGATTDDLLIACIGYRGTSATAPTLPTNWLQIEKRFISNTATNANASSSLIMAYIKRGATAPSFAFTGFNNAAIGRVLRLDGQDLNSPIDVSTSLLLTGSTATSGETAAIDMTRAGGMWIGCASAGSEGTNGAAYSNHLLKGLFLGGDLSMTEIGDNSTTLGADVDLGIAYLESNVDDLESRSYSWTHSPASRMAGALVHIKPPQEVTETSRSFAVIC